MSLFQPQTASRDANLDLLRATAITAVVVSHVIQMSLVGLPQPLLSAATYGGYGVDLFFALSGWLIGTLFWKEQMRFGSVSLGRFWMRRWLRTIPPYLVALGLSWLAVFLERREPFDWGFLVFAQNYYAVMPFFFVSWSLCIEEHFYLFLPLLLAPIARERRIVCAVFVVLLIIAPASRFVVSHAGVSPVLGFGRTATHLRMEGLLLGFWAAWAAVFARGLWESLQRRGAWLIAAACALLIAFVALEDPARYRVGLFLLPLALVTILVVMVGRVPSALARSRVVHAIAVASYSVYLTHPLTIHLSRARLNAAPAVPRVLYFPLTVLLVALAGCVFYVAVERSSILVRDRLVRRRIERPATALAAETLAI